MRGHSAHGRLKETECIPARIGNADSREPVDDDALFARLALLKPAGKTGRGGHGEAGGGTVMTDSFDVFRGERLGLAGGDVAENGKYHVPGHQLAAGVVQQAGAVEMGEGFREAEGREPVGMAREEGFIQGIGGNAERLLFPAFDRGQLDGFLLLDFIGWECGIAEAVKHHVHQDRSVAGETASLEPETVVPGEGREVGSQFLQTVGYGGCRTAAGPPDQQV